jgi:pimeloyl-ACP methyl ester carboxylesterase
MAHTIKADADRLRGKRITSPALILWGKRDWTLNRDLPQWIDRQFTNPPRKVFFPDVGHWVIEARPDEVARIVIGFIDEDRVPA